MSGSVLSHIFGALRRAVGRILLWFLIGFVVVGAIVEGVSFAAAGGHFVLLGHIAAVALGLAFGYAAGLTVLVAEVIRFFIKGLQDLERDVRGELSGGSRVVEGIVQNIEKRL